MKRYSTTSIRSYSPASDSQGEWVKFDDAMKEIESLRQQLAAEKAKKDIDLVNDPAAWDRLDKALKEIESLRSDYENVCHDIELQNKQMMEWYADKRQAEDERDEWKRRFNVLWEWLGWHDPKNNVFVDDFPEAANWYEEE